MRGQRKVIVPCAAGEENLRNLGETERPLIHRFAQTAPVGCAMVSARYRTAPELREGRPMSWKRRWGIVTVLALVQAGIIVWYQGFFSGSAAPAQSPSAEKKVVTPKADPKKEPEPAAQGPAAPPPAVPAELPKIESSAEPPQLPKDLNAVPSIPVPPPPPAAALPESKPGTPPAPTVEEKLVPVKAEDVKPADPMPDPRRLADGTTDLKPAAAVVTNEKNFDTKPDLPTGVAPTSPADNGKPASLPSFSQTYAQVQTTTPMPPSASTPPPPETKPGTPNPNPLTPTPAPPTGPPPAPGGNLIPPMPPVPNPSPPAPKAPTPEPAPTEGP